MNILNHYFHIIKRLIVDIYIYIVFLPLIKEIYQIIHPYFYHVNCVFKRVKIFATCFGFL
jgi:hypothetical protein